MNSLFPTIQKVLALTGTAIVIAEDTLGPGTGDQKKAKVVADVQSKLPALAANLGIPGWAVSVFTNEGVLGFLIDSLVAIAKTSGHLPSSSAAPPVPPPSAAA